MITTKNPATGEDLSTYEELTEEQIDSKITLANRAFESWRETSLDERKKLMSKVGMLLRERKKEYAELMTKEMGKPIKQSYEEIEKCAWTADYYVQAIESILSPDKITDIDEGEALITFEPIGIVLAVMPWNFPFWQVLRFAIPGLLAGNVGLLKHASSVQGCAQELEKLFLDAGFTQGVFTNLCISSSQVESVIRDASVKAVTLTGSENAGKAVAQQAASEIKKTVLELGGSDPFIVLKDADIDLVAEQAVRARLRNAGQTCTAAKRFIVVKEVYDEFISKYKTHFEKIVVGDPMDEATEVGPLSSEQGLADIERQVKQSIELGAVVEIGGEQINRGGFYFAPTILSNVQKGMPVYEEETFGPVAAVIKADDESDAIRIANDTRFGLGATIWSKDVDHAKELVKQIDAGNVYINKTMTSDGRLPFGGVKKSGYGRELSYYGPREFMNVKSMWVNR